MFIKRIKNKKYKIMKKLFFSLALAFSVITYAQTTEAEKDLKTQNTDTTEGWRVGGTFGLNYTQVGLNNWAAGGQSSFALNGLFDAYANYKKGKSSWDNNLSLGYGVIKQGEDGDWIKSDDRILLNSKYGRKAAKNWYYAGLFNFKSQFAPGYNLPDDSTKISDFMAPGYFLGAIGMDYKPNDDFTVFLSPVTAKMTVVNNDFLSKIGAFGVDSGKTARLELGGYMRMMYRKEIMQNITFQTNLDLFSNYSENPQNIDVNWDNLISMKVNKYITVTYTTSLIYDDDIDITETKSDGTPKTDVNGNPRVGPRTQFKYVLAVGFQYKFGASKK